MVDTFEPLTSKTASYKYTSMLVRSANRLTIKVSSLTSVDVTLTTAPIPQYVEHQRHTEMTPTAKSHASDGRHAIILFPE